MAQDTANQLMRDFIAGDEQCFEQLYSRFKKPIFYYLLTTLKNEALAEELTHDTFLKIYIKKEQYNDEYSFTTWAWKIARNTAIDRARKKDALSYLDTEESMHLESHTDSALELSELLNGKIERELLLQAIDTLPENQREIVSLRLYSELELMEIATITDKNISSIKSLFYRAQKAIIKSCQHKIGEVV